MRKFNAALIGLLLFMASEGQVRSENVPAEQADSQAEISENSCVIEFWASKNYNYQGEGVAASRAFGLLGALVSAANGPNKDDQKRSELMDILTPDYIKSVFISTDITSILQKDQVILKYNELNGDKNALKNMISSKFRSSHSNSDCYYEIYVRDILVDKTFGKRAIGITFQLKTFNNNNVIKSDRYYGSGVLTLFPAEDPLKKEEAANNLKQVFREIVEKFVRKKLT